MSHSSGLPSEPPGEWWERVEGVPFDQPRRRPRPRARCRSPSSAGAAATTTATSPTACSARSSPSSAGRAGGSASARRFCSRWGCCAAPTTRSSRTPRGGRSTPTPATPGGATHGHAQHGARGPALWSTVLDLATFADFLLDGHRDVLSAETVAEMCTPQSGTPRGRPRAGLRAGGEALPGRVGHDGRPHGSMPGFPGGAPGGPRTSHRLRRAGQLHHRVPALRPVPPALGAAARGRAPAAAAVAAQRCGPRPRCATWSVCGTGATPRCGSAGTAPCCGPRTSSATSPTARGRWSATGSWAPPGTTTARGGLHRHVGAAGAEHLTCSTFVMTRTPYDPQAPVPGEVQRALLTVDMWPRHLGGAGTRMAGIAVRGGCRSAPLARGRHRALLTVDMWKSGTRMAGIAVHGDVDGSPTRAGTSARSRRRSCTGRGSRPGSR